MNTVAVAVGPAQSNFKGVDDRINVPNVGVYAPYFNANDSDLVAANTISMFRGLPEPMRVGEYGKDFFNGGVGYNGKTERTAEKYSLAWPFAKELRQRLDTALNTNPLYVLPHAVGDMSLLNLPVELDLNVASKELMKVLIDDFCRFIEIIEQDGTIDDPIIFMIGDQGESDTSSISAAIDAYHEVEEYKFNRLGTYVRTVEIPIPQAGSSPTITANRQAYNAAKNTAVQSYSHIEWLGQGTHTTYYDNLEVFDNTIDRNDASTYTIDGTHKDYRVHTFEGIELANQINSYIP